MSRSDRKALLHVQELFGVPHGCPGEVGRPSRMSGSVRGALPYVWEWLGDSPSCLGVVGGPPDDRELSGVPHGNLGGQP